VSLALDADRRSRLIEDFQAFFLDELELELSAFRAEHVLDFALKALGPQVYNQAVQDARKFLQQKLDDLEGEVQVG